MNPNLYADGKVCLSLLGTWSGPGWEKGVSTLSQVSYPGGFPALAADCTRRIHVCDDRCALPP